MHDAMIKSLKASSVWLGPHHCPATVQWLLEQETGCPHVMHRLPHDTMALKNYRGNQGNIHSLSNKDKLMLKKLTTSYASSRHATKMSQNLNLVPHATRTKAVFVCCKDSKQHLPQYPVIKGL